MLSIKVKISKFHVVIYFRETFTYKYASVSFKQWGKTLCVLLVSFINVLFFSAVVILIEKYFVEL